MNQTLAVIESYRFIDGLSFMRKLLPKKGDKITLAAVYQYYLLTEFSSNPLPGCYIMANLKVLNEVVVVMSVMGELTVSGDMSLPVLITIERRL